MGKPSIASGMLPDNVVLETQAMVDTIASLQEEKTRLQKALDDVKRVNESVDCVSKKLELFLLDVQSNYVRDGRWINVGIFGFIGLGKKTFAFVKDVSEDCLKVSFNPRIPSWASQVLDFISKLF